MSRKKFNLLTLGCKVNQYESEAIIELFIENGYTFADENDICDIYIINTCTVTNLSDRKSRQYISKARKINPDSIIAVIGCYSQVSHDEVINIPGVNVIIGTKNRNRIVELCEKAMVYDGVIDIVEKFDCDATFEDLKITKHENMTRAYIKVQDGCNQYCSYCIIPFARGPVRSRPMGNIIQEAMELSSKGFKEIILTGIHIASYGIDLDDNIYLIDVIEEIAKINSVSRIRLSSVEPRLITSDFLARLKNTGKVCDHFHLSLQSGSDRILKLMKRRYTSTEYYEKCELIRSFFPNAGITTDIIVGFPDESDEDFRKTVNFSEQVGLSKIHVFKYSPRKGTKAAEMKNQIHGDIKKERSNTLIELSNKLSHVFMEKMIGKEFEVLFEERHTDGYMYGYTSNYMRVKSEYKHEYINNIVKVRISSIQDNECFVII